MQSEERPFYHGTSATSARAILRDGACNSLEKIGAHALGIEIWQTLLKHGDEASFKTLFEQAGYDERLSVWALRQIVFPETLSRYDYRHFYATLNLARGYRYAKSRFHSELLEALFLALEVLRYLQEPLPAELSSRYPDIDGRLSNKSWGVILELKGIRYDRLTADDGTENVEDDFRVWDQMPQLILAGAKSVKLPREVRIKTVLPSDIVAIHDLRHWDGKIPEVPWLIPQKWRDAKMTPDRWLSTPSA